jgi:hypothetical protein
MNEKLMEHEFEEARRIIKEVGEDGHIDHLIRIINYISEGGSFDKEVYLGIFQRADSLRNKLVHRGLDGNIDGKFLVDLMASNRYFGSVGLHVSSDLSSRLNEYMIEEEDVNFANQIRLTERLEGLAGFIDSALPNLLKVTRDEYGKFDPDLTTETNFRDVINMDREGKAPQNAQKKEIEGGGELILELARSYGEVRTKLDITEFISAVSKLKEQASTVNALELSDQLSSMRDAISTLHDNYHTFIKNTQEDERNTNLTRIHNYISMQKHLVFAAYSAFRFYLRHEYAVRRDNNNAMISQIVNGEGALNFVSESLALVNDLFIGGDKVTTRIYENYKTDINFRNASEVVSYIAKTIPSGEVSVIYGKSCYSSSRELKRFADEDLNTEIGKNHSMDYANLFWSINFARNENMIIYDPNGHLDGLTITEEERDTIHSAKEKVRKDNSDRSNVLFNIMRGTGFPEYLTDEEVAAFKVNKIRCRVFSELMPSTINEKDDYKAPTPAKEWKVME